MISQSQEPFCHMLVQQQEWLNWLVQNLPDHSPDMALGCTLLQLSQILHQKNFKKRRREKNKKAFMIATCEEGSKVFSN